MLYVGFWVGTFDKMNSKTIKSQFAMQQQILYLSIFSLLGMLLARILHASTYSMISQCCQPQLT